MTKLIVWDFLVSIGHVTLIKEGCSGAETWLIIHTETRKGCVIENLSAPSSKENENIVISKDDPGKLSWDQKHMLVLDFLDHGDTGLSFIVVHLAYGGHFLQKSAVTSLKYCPFA
jgi:hypothetical protein